MAFQGRGHLGRVWQAGRGSARDRVQGVRDSRQEHWQGQGRSRESRGLPAGGGAQGLVGAGRKLRGGEVDTKVVRSGGVSEEEGVWPRSQARRLRWLCGPLAPKRQLLGAVASRFPWKTHGGTSPRRHPQQRLPIFKVKV